MNKDRRTPSPSDSRDARLAAALRANLARRKAQARGRALEGSASDTAGARSPEKSSKNETPPQEPRSDSED